MMKFYIASALENVATVRRVANILKAAGHHHTYDWTVHGSVQSEGPERLTEVAEAERQGVLNADMVIIILPGGRGTHAELGIALGDQPKKIIICAEDANAYLLEGRTCSFYWSDLVHRIVGPKDAWIEDILFAARLFDCRPPAQKWEG